MAWNTKSSEIESISRVGSERVWDIEMPVHHNFVANGIIAHNCHQVDIENEDTQFMRIINHLDGVAKKAGRLMHIVGVTGSPFRGTAHLTTFDFWDEVVYDIGVDRLTEMGFLSVPVYGFPDA